MSALGYAVLGGSCVAGMHKLLGPTAFYANLLFSPISLLASAIVGWKAGSATANWFLRQPISPDAPHINDSKHWGLSVNLGALVGVPAFMGTFAAVQYGLVQLVL